MIWRHKKRHLLNQRSLSILKSKKHTLNIWLNLPSEMVAKLLQTSLHHNFWIKEPQVWSFSRLMRKKWQISLTLPKSLEKDLKATIYLSRLSCHKKMKSICKTYNRLVWDLIYNQVLKTSRKRHRVIKSLWMTNHYSQLSIPQSIRALL